MAVKGGKRDGRVKAKKLRRDAEIGDGVVTEGGIDQSVYVGELMTKMMHYQADFTSYSKDMEIYLDQRKLEQSMLKRNYDYCRNVIDLCVHPLAHGVSRDTVLECVGTYVGMALVNPELRRQCNDHVVSALYPGIEKLGRSVENVVDRQHRTMVRRVNFIENMTGKELPFGVGRKLREAPYFVDSQDKRMLDLHDRAMRTRNYGRVPMTPETAAMMRLNFAVQYYYAAREPGVDISELQGQYHDAQSTLSALAKRDGIEESEINRNARLLVAQFSSVPGHEDLAVMFEDVAYGDVRRADYRDVEMEDGTHAKRWFGECVGEDDTPFEDWFSVREPRSVDEMRDQMTEYYKDVYASCDSFGDVVRVFNAPEFKQSCDLFRQMIRDDMPYMNTQQMEFVSEDDLLMSAQRAAGAWWAEEHPDCAADMAAHFDRWRDEARREQARKFGVDFDFDGEEDDYGLG